MHIGFEQRKNNSFVEQYSACQQEPQNSIMHDNTYHDKILI